MIIWINGAFGSGKTSVAYELHRRLPDSFVYDPEEIGFFLRDNLPESLAGHGDFQDIPLWRSLNLETLSHIAENFPGTVIVPMTVTNRQYWDELVGELSKTFELRHFILYAGRETLLKRLSSRAESQKSWAAKQIDRCLEAFDSEIKATKIYTDDIDIDEVVREIAGLSGIILPPDERSPLRKFLDKQLTKINHIR